MLFARHALLPAIFALSGFASPMGVDAVRAAMETRADAAIDDGQVEIQLGDLATPGAEAVPAAPPSPATPLTFRRSADGLFYVNAKVNGTSVRFVVDTGSSVVVLSPRDAAALGVAPSRNGFGGVVRTASGNAAMAWTRLDTVSVGNVHIRDLRAAVVREGLSVSLMGQDMLSRMGEITIRGDELAFN